MTSDPSDQPPPQTPDPGGLPEQAGFKEGIYLETKKSNIGTGVTAKTTEYRTFWATGSFGTGSAVMVLLDDAFKPTAIKETFSYEALTGPNWFYIAEGEKRYHLIRPLLDRLLAPQPQPASAKAAPSESPANWWGGDEPSGPPANPFELKKKPKAPPPKKGGWWDK